MARKPEGGNTVEMTRPSTCLLAKSLMTRLSCPDRGRSVRPASRCWQNRRRHFRTVSTCTPRSAAIPVFDPPRAAARMIVTRTTSR